MKPVKLSRQASGRNLVVRNLATSLVLYERIQTTPAKARAAQMHTERLITLAKKWKLATDPGVKLALRRQMISRTADKLAVKKLTEVLADLFEKREGGYTRKIKIGRRLGDAAEQVILSLTERSNLEVPKPATKPAKVEKAEKATETKSVEEK